jgi:hypothetical protein
MMVNREGSAYPIIDWSLSSEGKYAASIVCDPAAHLIVIESNYIEEEYASSSSSNSYGGPEGVSIGIPEGKTFVLDGFVNGGFEDGTFNGWTQTQGYWDGPNDIYTDDEAYAIYGDTTPYFNNCEIVNSIFPDLRAGGTPIGFEGNGNKVARVNDGEAGVSDDGYFIGARWSKISQTVTNWNHDNICFSWNAVLEDPYDNHGDLSPMFMVKLFDETTSTPIYNVNVNVLGELPVPGGWKISGPTGENKTWKYSDWQTIVLNTSLLIGHNLTLSISAYDCAELAHGGYVYVDNVGYYI